jgi:hypothetical protein
MAAIFSAIAVTTSTSAGASTAPQVTLSVSTATFDLAAGGTVSKA